MKKDTVIVTPTGKPFHGISVGQHFELAPRIAAVLVRLNKIEYVAAGAVPAKAPKPKPPAPPPAPIDEYDSMDYDELRDLVKERDLEPEGRSKADYLAALRSPGKYLRRDMTAED